MKDDIKEIKEILKAQDAKFSKFVEASEKKFLTRLEGRVVMTVFALIVTATTLWLNLKDHIR